MPKGVDISTPELAYVTKDNIVYPSYAPDQTARQAQADEVEIQALAQATAQGSVNGTKGPGGVAPGALATSGTKTTVERDGLKAQT